MHRFMVHEAAGKIVLVCPSSFANLISTMNVKPDG